jgi:hypothetical protein
MRRACGGIALVVALACAGQTGAEMDHLTGYKVKESTTPPQSLHTVQDALGSGNCTLKKAKFYLTGAEKDAGDDARGGPAGDYICYTAKCDLPSPSLPLKEDQRGAHALETKSVKIVCLPAVDDAVPAPCEATTGGFCWFLGAEGESCDTVCANNGRLYDSATETYAGSGGTDGNCEDVWAALGGPGDYTNLVSCSVGNGCSGLHLTIPIEVDVFTRCTPSTTAAASSATVKRACACQ